LNRVGIRKVAVAAILRYDDVIRLGVKAYDADIQKCVVTMKDELEIAKEQVLNVL